ncbi:MAG TPA: hypothetical protein VJX73_07695 [Terracidiphilus sp.]|nr:hypothetical protein [Terracidiphilus sp.]
MKYSSLVVLSLLLAPPLFADAGQRIIPAGALVSCTTGDGKISSKTTAVGDPVLCKVNFHRGDFMLPYGSYLGGNFAEYKDPGHFVGKGWMQLDFDRLYVGDQVIPLDAKVVDVPGYKIDSHGRILGKGHPVRDTVLWMIPVLWPIDLINLPRRGPRPTLKAETALTLRVMDDIRVPVVPEPQRDPYGLMQRSPDAYAPQPPAPMQEPETNPAYSYAPPDQPMAPAPADYAPEQPVAPPVMSYAPPVAVAPMPYYAPAYVAPPVVAYGYGYGGFGVGVRPGVYAYGARGYVRAPMYAPRSYAPAVRGYGYSYAARGYVSGGYAARGPMVSARGGAGFGRR